MRILVFSFEYPPAIGGAERMAHRVSEHLHLAGHQVRVLSLGQPHDKEFDAQQPFLVRRTVDTVPHGATPLEKVRQKSRILSKLQREVREFQPDVIFCPHWDPCGYLAWLCTRLNSRVPYFVVGHGTEVLNLSGRGPARQVKRVVRRATFRHAAGVFAVSRFTKERLVGLGIEPRKITVIPNGVGEEEIVPFPPRVRGDMADRPRLLTVCRLVPRKGCDTVIQALPPLLSRYPNLDYCIVGDGPERGQLQVIARSLGVAEKVHFYGEVGDDRKDQIYRQSDLFLMPARMGEATGRSEQPWLDMLHRKFERYFADPRDANVQRWLATARDGITTKGRIHCQDIERLAGRSLDGWRVLDAGCGTGDVALALAAAGASVIAIDSDTEFIEIGELRRLELSEERVRFVWADLCQGLPVDVGRFDLVLSIDVVEHVADPTRYLMGLYQLMKPGGRLYLLTGNKLALSNLRHDPHYKLAGVVLMPKRLARWYVCSVRKRVQVFDVERMFSVGELSSLVCSSGFQLGPSLARRDAQIALQHRPFLARQVTRMHLETAWGRVYEQLWPHTIKIWAMRPA